MVASSSSFIVLLLLGLITAVAAFNKYDENALFVGQRIRNNEMLRWGRHRLILQADCQLIFRGSHNELIWQSNTQYAGNDCSVVMRRDGNLVLYGDTNNVVWESRTAGSLGDYVCLLQEDFNLVVYGSPIWNTRLHYPPIYVSSSSSSSSSSSLSSLSSSSSVRAPPPSNGRYDQNVLYEGERLSVNQELRTKFFRFAMQSDCNLVVYSTYTDIWKSNTEGRGVNCYLELQRDGNLVIFNDSANPVWQSGTAKGNGDYVLILQDDGNVFLYSKALWSIRPITTTAALTSNSTTVLRSDIAMVTGAN